MATSNIILHGAGGHARVVVDAAFAQGHTVDCLYDPGGPGQLFGIPIKTIYYPTDFPNAKIVVAIGDNAIRQRVSQTVAHPLANIIHPSAILSPYSTVGKGNMILHGAIAQAESVIGNHVIINTSAQVDHHCIISDYVHLAPGVILCGNVHIGEGSFIGAGAIVIPGKKIGAWSIVGAGSVVIDNIPDNCVAVGNPAKVIKHWRPNLHEA